MSKHLLDLFPFLSSPASLNHFNQLWLFCVNYTTLSSHPKLASCMYDSHMYYIWPYLFCHLKTSCNYVPTTYLIYTIEKKQKNVPVKSGILCLCPRPWIITLPDIQEHHMKHLSGASKELFPMLSKQNNNKNSNATTWGRIKLSMHIRSQCDLSGIRTIYFANHNLSIWG